MLQEPLVKVNTLKTTVPDSMNVLTVAPKEVPPTPSPAGGPVIPPTPIQQQIQQLPQQVQQVPGASPVVNVSVNPTSNVAPAEVNPTTLTPAADTSWFDATSFIPQLSNGELTVIAAGGAIALFLVYKAVTD